MIGIEWDRLSVYPYKEENIQELICRIFSILEELKRNGNVFDSEYFYKTVEELTAKTKGIITLEQLGAVGDGSADDIGAFDKAKMLLDKGIIRKVIGYGTYAVSRTIMLSSMNGIEYDLGQIKPYGVFRDDYLVQAGDKGGSQGNLIFKAVLIDGINRGMGGINITSTGGSTFDVGTIINCGVGIALDNPVQISSDNLLKGNYIKACNYGIVIRSENHSACEGTMIRYNFIYDNDYAGILLGKGSHYTDIQGATDFNGKKTALLKVDRVAGLSPGTVINKDGHKATVIEVMSKSKLVYLVSTSVLANSKIFNVGDHINGCRIEEVNVNNTGEMYQQYLDIINANESDAGFSRNTMMLAYCGGIYGSRESINTDTIFTAKTGQNERNFLSGVSIWSNNESTTVSDYLGNKNIFKYNHKDSIDINGNGIYSRKVGYGNLTTSPTIISRFDGDNEKLDSGIYLVTISPESRKAEYGYVGILFWNKDGNTHLHTIKDHNMTVSVQRNNELQAQLSNVTLTVYTTYLKIS